MKLVLMSFSLQIVSIINVIGQTQYVELEGSVKDVPNKTKIYLIKSNQNGTADTIQASYTINGNFRLRGEYVLPGEIWFVKLDSSAFKLIGNVQQTWVPVIIDKNKLKIKGSLKTWPAVIILGSNATKKYLAMIDSISGINKIFHEQYEQFIEDSMHLINLNNRYRTLIAQIITRYQKEIPSAMIAYNMRASFTFKQISGIYQSLSENVQRSYYGLKLGEALGSLKLMDKLNVKGELPEFDIENTEGAVYSIVQLTSGNKLTLIDFWASWCKPCRAEIPHLKDIYSKFKDKGFNVVGISTDANRNEWLRAVKEEDIPWIQTRQGKTNISKDLFGIQALPAYVLVDNAGKVIALNSVLGAVESFGPPIRGNGLAETLNRLLSK